MKTKSQYLLIGLAYLGFISLGLPDGLLGVAWPSIYASFHLPLDAMGGLLLIFTCGYLLASFSSGEVLARMNVGALLAWSSLATAASLLGYALAPAWWMMVALGLLSGLGAGAIDAGLNSYAATHFTARVVNWLHASYGLGATSGPLIMTAVLSAGNAWQAGYGLVGLCQVALAAAFGCTRKHWSNGRAAPEMASPKVARSVSPGNTLRMPMVWLSMVVFFIYAGIEAAAGAWSYSLFTAGRAIPMLRAGTWVSVYWGCLTAGRLLSGLVTNLISVRLLLRLCMAGIALGATLIWLDLAHVLSFGGLALIGLSCAPIFPMMIATTPQRFGAAHTANAIGHQIAAAVLGQSMLPGLVGVLARAIGWEIIAPALLVAAVLLWVAHEIMSAMRPQSAQEVHALA